MLRALREHQRRRDANDSDRARDPGYPQHAELAGLRHQTTKLAALIDHYYAAYREAQALLSRREQELAELRRRLDSKPVRIAK